MSDNEPVPLALTRDLLQMLLNAHGFDCAAGATATDHSDAFIVFTVSERIYALRLTDLTQCCDGTPQNALKVAVAEQVVLRRAYAKRALHGGYARQGN